MNRIKPATEEGQHGMRQAFTHAFTVAVDLLHRGITRLTGGATMSSHRCMGS